ncbi:MAG: hypothetical protein WEB05_07955 [Solirubrobacterales bacterium]
MNTEILWKSALVQLVLVAVLSISLAILLPHSFFETWGWVSGPLAWLICAAATAGVLSLPAVRTLLGAILAGLPSLIAVVIGIHWLGVIIAVTLFAFWCAYGTAQRSQ